MYGTYISHFHQASSFLLSKLHSKSKKCIVFLITQNTYIYFFKIFGPRSHHQLSGLFAVEARKPWSNSEGAETSLRIPHRNHGSASTSLTCFTGEKHQPGQEEGLLPAQGSIQWDTRTLLLQNPLLYGREHKTTNVYVACWTSLSNTN